MTIGEARIKAKQMYGKSGYAVLRGANKKLHVVGFIDKTGSELGIDVTVATAPSFEEAFAAADPSTASYYLKRSAELQQEFWAAVAALDAAVGCKVDRRRDLSKLKVDDLRDFYATKTARVRTSEVLPQMVPDIPQPMAEVHDFIERHGDDSTPPKWLQQVEGNTGHEEDDDDECERSVCQNCGRIWKEDELNAIKHLSERVVPGEPMPSGSVLIVARSVIR